MFENLHKCSSCEEKQYHKSMYDHIKHRVRRSNSCPSNDLTPYMPTSTNSSKTTKKVTMIKKWHSLQTVRFNDSYNSRSSSGEATPTPIAVITSSSQSTPVWAPFRRTTLTPTLSLSKRVTSLFTFGVALAIILNLLQRQKNVTVFSPGMFGDVLNSAWWMPPAFGFGAIITGLLYPKIDEILGQAGTTKLEWSRVMRCVAVFVGINHASAKITFDSNIHLSLTLGLLSLGLWYFFDNSISGLGLGIAITCVATAITQLLAAMDVFGYSNPDFLYMQSWVPCLFFSGGVTVGAVGRALATFEDVAEPKQHME